MMDETVCYIRGNGPLTLNREKESPNSTEHLFLQY